MIASAVAQYLDGLGIVDYDPTGITGDTFIDLMPERSGTTIAIFDYPGPQPDALHGYDYPNVQVRVRAGRDPRVAKAKLMQVYAALHNLHAVDLPGGIHAVSCWARQSGPAPLGPDGNGRYEFTQSYELHIRNVTTHRV